MSLWRVSHFIHYYAECHYTEYRYSECHYAECRYSESHYAECRYAECHYAECLGTHCCAYSVRSSRPHFEHGLYAIFMLATNALAYYQKSKLYKNYFCPWLWLVKILLQFEMNEK